MCPDNGSKQLVVGQKIGSSYGTEYSWNGLEWIVSPTGKKNLLEFKFCYYATGKFAQFIFRLLLYVLESLNDSLYNLNSKIKIC